MGDSGTCEGMSTDESYAHNPRCLCGHRQTKHRYDVGFTKCQAKKCLARVAGIKAHYLSLVEAGKREPSVNVLRGVAKALNVPIRMLFWEAEQLPDMSSVKEENTLLKIKRLLFEMEALRLADHTRSLYEENTREDGLPH